MTDPTPDPNGGVVIAFPSARVSFIPDNVPLFEPTPNPDLSVPTSKPRQRKPATLSRTARPRPKPREPRTAEAKRALEIAEMYAVKQPLSNKQRVADAIETAIRVGTWSDGEIVAAVERLVDSPYGVTENTLRVQLGKAPRPERVVDPVIHQAIDAAMEHLGRLEREQMTETEQTLAAAMRQICIAVMHQAANPTQES